MVNGPPRSGARARVRSIANFLLSKRAGVRAIFSSFSRHTGSFVVNCMVQTKTDATQHPLLGMNIGAFLSVFFVERSYAHHSHFSGLDKSRLLKFRRMLGLGYLTLRMVVRVRFIAMWWCRGNCVECVSLETVVQVVESHSMKFHESFRRCDGGGSQCPIFPANVAATVSGSPDTVVCTVHCLLHLVGRTSVTAKGRPVVVAPETTSRMRNAGFLYRR